MDTQKIEYIKSAMVRLLNHLHSSFNGYVIKYRHDDNSIIANLVDGEGKVPVVNRTIVSELVYTGVLKVDGYMPGALDVYKSMDNVIEYNGEVLGYSSNDGVISKDIYGAFKKYAKALEDTIILKGAFLNMGYDDIISFKFIGNDVINRRTEVETDYLYFYYTLVCEKIVANVDGVETVIDAEGLLSYQEETGVDAKEDLLAAIFSSVTFAQNEGMDNNTAHNFYAELRKYWVWNDDGIYEDFYPWLNIVMAGMKGIPGSYNPGNYWRDVDDRERDKIVALLDYLNNK